MGIGSRIIGAALLCGLLLCLPSDAGAFVGRSRVRTITSCQANYTYPVYQQQSYAAQVVAPAYVAPQHYDQQTLILPVRASDYYFTAQDSYRDNLIADAAAFRVVQQMRSNITAPPQSLQQAPPAWPTPAAPQNLTAGHPGFGVFVESCTKCHDVTVKKGGVAFMQGGQMLKLTRDDAWTIRQQVRSGKMPPGSPLATDRKAAALDYLDSLPFDQEPEAARASGLPTP